MGMACIGCFVTSYGTNALIDFLSTNFMIIATSAKLSERNLELKCPITTATKYRTID